MCSQGCPILCQTVLRTARSPSKVQQQEAGTTGGMESHTSTGEAVAGLCENEAILVYRVRPYGSVNVSD